ncbi:hypothetical protein CMI47_20925 [Candidatus Pacearchaeota archaeon]|nr:hypothetical protein [Candidatus Pacearchaeota archaeon]
MDGRVQQQVYKINSLNINMRNTSVIIIISILLLIIIATIILISLPQEEELPSPQLEECQTLSYNSESAINLVFFAPKEQAQKYYDSLLQFSPMKENAQEFNAFYISDYIPECELYKGIALLCYSNDLVKKAASCPADYIITIRQEEPSIRSSSYLNVMSINSAYTTSVLAHEFGHAFANLAEEYVPASLPRGQKNCVKTCDSFQSETNGCFDGCSQSNYKRSISSGIMRTLSSNTFGIFDESLISERISSHQSKVTASAISDPRDCSQEKYYSITFQLTNGIFSLTNKSIESGCQPTSGFGPSSYQIIKNSQVLSTNDINPLIIFTDLPDETSLDLSGETLDYEGPVVLTTPAIPIDEIKIFDSDSKELISVNLNDIDSRPCKK